MTVPDGLRYTSEHEWLSTEGTTALVGITDYAQKALGDVVFVSIPPVGTRVRAGDAFGEIESVKAVSEVYSPFDGEISEVNEELDDEPELLNSDPYGAGWLLRIKLDSDGDQVTLLSAAEYTELTGETD